MLSRTTVPIGVLVAGFMSVTALASPGDAVEPSRTDAVVAQAGSTGGTLGNDDKSASGGQGAPSTKAPARSVKPTRAAAVPRPQPAPRPMVAPAPVAPTQRMREATPSGEKQRVRQAAPSAESFDGIWKGASTGACILRWSWSFTVTNGIMTGDGGNNITGRVRPGGETNGRMVVFGTTYDFAGQMGANRVAGTWVKLGESGCSGTWSATR